MVYDEWPFKKMEIRTVVEKKGCNPNPDMSLGKYMSALPWTYRTKLNEPFNKSQNLQQVE